MALATASLVVYLLKLKYTVAFVLKETKATRDC